MNYTIHPTAVVDEPSAIGPGTMIWHWAHIMPGAVIGSDCTLGQGVFVDRGVLIGNNCKLQNGVWVYHGARVEDGVFLGPGVILTNDRHPGAINPDGTLKIDADWEIGETVVQYGASVGAGAIVLAGVIIGRWAMVGMGAIVIRDVPDHGLVVGNPARLIGYACMCRHKLVEKVRGEWVCGKCDRSYNLTPLSEM